MGLGRIYRLLQLMSVLGSGRAHNADQLAQVCEVSRRTIFRDLKTLDLSGVPVEYDPTRQGYRVATGYFLPATNLSVEEALGLLVVCYELGDRDGLPFHSAARTAALKLQCNLPGTLRDHLNDLTERIHVRLGQTNPLAGDEPAYRQLLDAIAGCRAVRIVYDSLTEWETIQTRLFPYRVFFSRRSWYVIGRSSLHRSVRIFNVARIKKLEPLDDRYQIPPRFSLDRHLGNAWHLIRERGRRTRVRIRFEKMVAQNVAEVHWHKTQKTRWNPDGTLDFRVTVDGLNEISWWVLGYGDQAEVLEPSELRELLHKRIEAMRMRYAKPRAKHGGRQTRSAAGKKKSSLKKR